MSSGKHPTVQVPVPKGCGKFAERMQLFAVTVHAPSVTVTTDSGVGAGVAAVSTTHTRKPGAVTSESELHVLKEPASTPIELLGRPLGPLY